MEVDIDDDLLPEVLEADLLCETDEDIAKLKDIVSKTKVVLTCSGPFELYGKKLVELCAQLGVHYGDVTGETDFFREMISTHDTKARETGACIISHCGNDCIPTDLTVYEINEYAKSKGMSLLEVQTYAEYGDGASWSGGTLATAAYQLGKDRNNKDKTNFDPLYTSVRRNKHKFWYLEIFIVTKQSTHPNLLHSFKLHTNRRTDLNRNTLRRISLPKRL